MLKDGVYELLYRSEADADSGFDSLLLALRNGNVIGSDRWGGVFLGRCEFDKLTFQHRVHVRLHVPPGGMLITDEKPWLAGGSVDVSVIFDDDREIALQSGLVDVGGQQVRVELKFKGPVPQ